MPHVRGRKNALLRKCWKFCLKLRTGRIAQRRWLGGLDSNQDIQIQSLVSYRLNDLPTQRKGGKTPQATNLKTVNGQAEIVNRARRAKMRA